MELALVTGATGTVGHAIVQRLLAAGARVRALARDPARARRMLPPGVEIVAGDLGDAGSLARAAAGCADVYHAAGLPEQWLPDPDRFHQVNVVGTRNVVAAASAAGVRAFVYTSTIDVFAWERDQPFDESRLDPAPKHTVYERSKQEADRLVVEALERDRLPVRFLHPAAVYGPVPVITPGLNALLERLATNGAPLLLPGGLPVVHAADVAEGHLRAATRPPGSRYILSESFVTLRALAQAVHAVHPAARVPRVMPMWVGKALSEGGEAVARLTRKPPLVARGQLTFLRSGARPDAARARRELGLSFIPLAEGLRQTIPTLLSARAEAARLEGGAGGHGGAPEQAP